MKRKDLNTPGRDSNVVPPERAPRQGETAAPSPGRLVLLVDDFADDREMYSFFLSQNGFRVVLASESEEALAKALILGPDVIIMDLGLPGVGGWEVIRRLKSDSRTRQIPIVVLTGRAFASAQAIGSDSCLIKPCLPHEVLAEVNRVVNAEVRAAAPSFLP